jgi:hypothetical protein
LKRRGKARKARKVPKLHQVRSKAPMCIGEITHVLFEDNGSISEPEPEPIGIFDIPAVSAPPPAPVRDSDDESDDW